VFRGDSIPAPALALPGQALSTKDVISDMDTPNPVRSHRRGSSRLYLWETTLIAGKRRHMPILILSALIVMVAFLIYVGVQRSQTTPPVDEPPMHSQQ
jgi:hypothetical protein